MKLPSLNALNIKIPPRARRILAWSGYPIFYLFCLAVFAYLTFPYDQLKERLIAELESSQKGPAPRVEVDSLGPYWLGGVSAKGLRITMPRTPTPGDPTERPPSKLTIDKVHARLSLLSLLIGRVSVSFGANAFGGTIDGDTHTSSEGRKLEATLEGVDIGRVEPLTDLLGGAPISGTLSGKIEWLLGEQKLSKASGPVSLSVADLSIGDGKAKLAGKLALPKLNVGQLDLAGEAKTGVLKFEKLGAQGQDLDLLGDGRIVLRDSFMDSMADLYLRFRFSDGYRNRNDMTKSLFGAPGSTMPALFELADPRIKASKRPDGYYGWHMAGELKDPRFDASASGGTFGTGSPAAPGFGARGTVN